MNKTEGSFIILDQVDSTNNYAMGLIHSGMAKSETAILAIEQTNGKGRQNKEWRSGKGENITMSVIKEHSSLPIYRQFELSMVVSLACVDFFNIFNLGAQIKWPNDIFLNDKKAGGILIENVILGSQVRWSVIGIGININQKVFESNIIATSISMATGVEYDIVQMAKALKQCLQKRMELLGLNMGSEILEEYNKSLFKINLNCRIKRGNAIFETTIKGVNMNGELMTKDTMERVFELNEVQWLL